MGSESTRAILTVPSSCFHAFQSKKNNHSKHYSEVYQILQSNPMLKTNNELSAKFMFGRRGKIIQQWRVVSPDNSIDGRSGSAYPRGEALRLIKSLRSFVFVALTIGNLVIGSANDLCQQLQGKDLIIFYQIYYRIEHKTCLLLELWLNEHFRQI